MTTEQKTKAYDEAIEAIRKCETDKYGCVIGIKPSDIFPELKESEGDKTKRMLDIITYKMSQHQPDIFTGEENEWFNTWLEKQGEQKSFDYENTNIQQKDFAPKIEPKFHEGEWCIDNEDGTIFQIVKVLDNTYTYKTNIGKEYSCTHYSLENNANLWTIQDAKDGDVLSFNDGHGNDCIELIKSITGKKIEFWFCLTNGNYYEVFDGITPYTNLVSREDATPATKEQRDLLFQKMKEAGYEWDAEKKEPKRIEKKQSWSEEDEKIIKRIDSLLYSQCKIHESEYEEIRNWLKSLSPQNAWRPSDEQIKALEAMLTVSPQSPAITSALIELYKQLKY